MGHAPPPQSRSVTTDKRKLYRLMFKYHLFVSLRKVLVNKFPPRRSKLLSLNSSD